MLNINKQSCTGAMASTVTPDLHNLWSNYSMPTPSEVLRASVEAHNDTFEALLNLIPAKYYLVKDDDANDVRYFQGIYWHQSKSHRAH